MYGQPLPGPASAARRPWQDLVQSRLVPAPAADSGAGTLLTPAGEGSTMLAARFCQPGDVRVEEVPDPEPGPGDVLIRVRNCSVCGADRKTIQHGHHRLSPPRVLGHEIAGEVVSAGTEVMGWAAGDRVQVIAAIPCGACRECQAGHATVCARRENMGYQHDGGFAEFMLVPAKVIAVGGLEPDPGRHRVR